MRGKKTWVFIDGSNIVKESREKLCLSSFWSLENTLNSAVGMDHLAINSFENALILAAEAPGLKTSIPTMMI